MNKLIAVVLLIVLICPAALADADPYAIANAFFANCDSRWRREEIIDDYEDTLTINAFATLDGYPCEFGVGGIREDYGWRACQVWYACRFDDLRMRDDATFPDSLAAYNDVMYALERFLPDASAAEDLFSAYDIYYTVQNGPYAGDLRGWELIDAGGGELAARHPVGPILLDAQKLDDGRLWFVVLM